MRLLLFAGVALLALTPVRLAWADIDTSDIDSYLMQDMENAIKDLEPVLTVRNAESARADAHILRDGLQWTHDYFIGKGAQDAVSITVEGQAAVARVIAALDAVNFDDAIAAARDTAANCKSCHEIYKD
jgi:hypothetical protein